MSRAIVEVVVRGRGPGRLTRGQDVLVTANGHALPVLSMELRVEGRRAIAKLEIAVDSVLMSDVPATLRFEQSEPEPGFDAALEEPAAKETP